MDPGGMMWPGLVGFLTIVSLLLVLAGATILFIWARRRLAGADRANSSSPNPGAAAGVEEAPLVIAQRRYARGEIGPEEYERIRADLLRDAQIVTPKEDPE